MTHLFHSIQDEIYTNLLRVPNFYTISILFYGQTATINYATLIFIRFLGCNFLNISACLFYCNININLCSFNRAMPQDLLHTTNIYSFFNQISSEWMSEHMRSLLFLSIPTLFCYIFHHYSNWLFCKTLTSLIHKKNTRIVKFPSYSFHNIASATYIPISH